MLVLGAGQVSPALLAHLKGIGYSFTVADRDLEAARARVAEVGSGEARQLDLTPSVSPEVLLPEFAKADLVISILPPPFHPAIARACIHARTPLVTASYVSDEMAELDEAAREAGIILLNEMGLDPGIDHMSAIKLIEEIHAAGGEVERFGSFCGGLPAPDAADNPLSYKFSWSPAGVVRATLNAATFLRDGAPVTVPAEALFAEPAPLPIEGATRAFESYPNRNSLPYVNLYGVPEAQDFMRGTIRYAGWGHFWNALRHLGWLSEQPAGTLPATRGAIAQQLGLTESDPLVGRLEWLLAGRAPAEGEPPIEALIRFLLEKEALRYSGGERDMVIMLHRATVRFPDGRREVWTATLTLYGEPGGVSAMSLTTGGTIAIGAEAILEGIIDEPGVQIPTDPALANFALAKVAAKGVRFEERRESLVSEMVEW